MSTALDTFDLGEARTVLLQDGSRSFRLNCRRITPSDWQTYFDGIYITAEQQGNVRISTVEAASARLKLADSVIIEAFGYKVDGGLDLNAIAGWQQRLPLNHRKLLGEVLADVRPAAPTDEFVIYPEGEVVYLDATFTARAQLDEQGLYRWSMVKLTGLKHVLRTPSEEQHRRFMRESSRSKIVGGSRSGKTIYPVAHPLLAKLYDELVISVEGYSVNGTALTTDSTTIRTEMDMLHKVIAAQQLFQPLDTTSLGGENNE